ncbi:MAG TPA: hypothetical protein DIT64_12880 [Verrucomicrobiales bacterium]|nr:hypothetical protein [Verrucomicrobiales bacterium]HCN79156.1 hypothetical protein [Verrucomicrobiales bacterium]HRJ71240.1 hypothetical protein [Terrimicrobiaceae bacterium]HRK17286.1 hypothetical protein [Prosthecobacter sp.]
MNSAPSIAEQIQVLQSRQDVAAWALARLGLPKEWRDTNQPGNTPRCQEAVDRLFTLARADLEDALAAQGLAPEQLPHVETRPGSSDGAYFIAKGPGSWEYYYQERGMPWIGVHFDDLAEARKLLLNDYIPVWLDRLHIPARTSSGKKITRM